MPATTTTMLGVLMRQFAPSLEMLADIVETCPHSAWSDSRSGRPLWQRVLHALISVQFWFREASEPFAPPDLGTGPVPDLDQRPVVEVDKDTVQAYLQTIRARADTFFASLDDERLLAPCSICDKCTYADLILGQIRHLQHHVGYCNSLLQAGGAPAAKWRGHAE
jgi:hypothetical protein